MSSPVEKIDLSGHSMKMMARASFCIHTRARVLSGRKDVENWFRSIEYRNLYLDGLRIHIFYEMSTIKRKLVIFWIKFNI